MAWPTGAVNTTNLDQGSDSPALARADLLAAIQKLNSMIAALNQPNGVLGLDGTSGASINGILQLNQPGVTGDGKAFVGGNAPAGFTRLSNFYVADQGMDTNELALITQGIQQNLAYNTWATVGGTGSGATFEWAALDSGGAKGRAKAVDILVEFVMEDTSGILQQFMGEFRKAGATIDPPHASITSRAPLPDAGTVGATTRITVPIVTGSAANFEVRLNVSYPAFPPLIASAILKLAGWWE